MKIRTGIPSMGALAALIVLLFVIGATTASAGSTDKREQRFLAALRLSTASSGNLVGPGYDVHIAVPSPALTNTTYLPLLATQTHFELVYRDDFSNPASGWYVGENSNVRWSYQQGKYEILVRRPNYWAAEDAPWSGPNNYLLQVDALQLSGANGGPGLIFGLQDWGHFYLLLVDAHGQRFRLLKYATPTWTALVDWTPSTAINPAPAMNQLKVRRNGASISVFANGQFLASAQDASYTGVSRVGLLASTAAGAPATVRFDNFRVWRPASLAGEAEARPVDLVSPGYDAAGSPIVP